MSTITITITITIILFFAHFTSCDINEDRAKCADTLGAVITCLPYVSDQAKGPTPDCCTGFGQVLKDSPQCICLLIKDRNDPSLGLQIDISRAIALPQICKTVTNQTIGDCPAILQLPPNSPDAQVFRQFANVTGSKTNAQAPSPVTTGSSSSGPTAAVSATNPTSSDKTRLKCETASFWVMISIVAARMLAFT